MKKYTLLILILIVFLNYFQPFSYRINDEQLPGNLQNFITDDFIDTRVYGPTAMVNGKNYRFTLAQPISSFYERISPIWLDFFFYKGNLNNEQIKSKENAYYSVSKYYNIKKNINSIHFGNLSGSSTGLAYALSYISANFDNFIPKDQHILATGSINKHGDVFGVGAIEAKFKNKNISKMDIILGPKVNISSIRREYFKNHDRNVFILGVENVKQAVEFICFINKNKSKPCGDKKTLVLSSDNIHLCNDVINKRKIKCSWSVKGDKIIIK